MYLRNRPNGSKSGVFVECNERVEGIDVVVDINQEHVDEKPRREHNIAERQICDQTLNSRRKLS